MKIKVTPKLRVLACYLNQTYRERIRGDIDGEGTEELLRLSMVSTWLQNMEDNVFAESYSELELSEACWLTLLLLEIERNYCEGISRVVYRLDDRVIIFSDEELDEKSVELFGPGESFELQEDPEVAQILEALDAETFDFMDYVSELIAEAKA